METGEKELRKAFEEVTTRNVTGMVAYSKDTRKLVRELEDNVKGLKDLVVTQNVTIAELRRQLSIIQAIVYRGGTA